MLREVLLLFLLRFVRLYLLFNHILRLHQLNFQKRSRSRLKLVFMHFQLINIRLLFLKFKVILIKQLIILRGKFRVGPKPVENPLPFPNFFPGVPRQADFLLLNQPFLLLLRVLLHEELLELADDFALEALNNVLLVLLVHLERHVNFIRNLLVIRPQLLRELLVIIVEVLADDVEHAVVVGEGVNPLRGENHRI